jgi:hypothetical protein
VAGVKATAWAATGLGARGLAEARAMGLRAADLVLAAGAWGLGLLAQGLARGLARGLATAPAGQVPGLEFCV